MKRTKIGSEKAKSGAEKIGPAAKKRTRVGSSQASKAGSAALKAAPQAQVVAEVIQQPAPAAAAPGVGKPAVGTMTVVANIDVGFGNALYLRGQGAGLSWDKGILMECVDGRTWRWSTKEAKKPVMFKVLLNDQVWCEGEDCVAGSGETVEVSPRF